MIDRPDPTQMTPPWAERQAGAPGPGRKETKESVITQDSRATWPGGVAIAEVDPIPATDGMDPAGHRSLPALTMGVAPFVMSASRERQTAEAAPRSIDLPVAGCWTLVVLEDGTMQVTEGGQTWEMKAGQCFIAHPGRPVTCEIPPRGRFRRVDFDVVFRPRRPGATGWTAMAGAPAQPTPQDLWLLEPPRLLPASLTDTTQALAREISSTFWRSGNDHHRCNLLLAGWLARVFTEVSDVLSGEAANVDDAIAVAERSAREGFAHGCTVADMAKAAGLSQSALERRWRDMRGEPPGAYLRHLRYELARRLLEQGVPVAEAAFNSGFRSRPTFARGFRRLMGASPAEWRRRRRGLG